MSKSPKCKLCGAQHWLSEPHAVKSVTIAATMVDKLPEPEPGFEYADYDSDDSDPLPENIQGETR